MATAPHFSSLSMERPWETLPTSSLNQLTFLPPKQEMSLTGITNVSQKELRIPEFSFLNDGTILPERWLGMRLELTSMGWATEQQENRQRALVFILPCGLGANFLPLLSFHFTLPTPQGCCKDSSFITLGLVGGRASLRGVAY